MKTTMRNSLLVLFLSLISVAFHPCRCDDTASLLNDGGKGARKLEELIGQEVTTSLQVLEDEDDDSSDDSSSQSDSKETKTGYYVTSQGEGKPGGKLDVSGESDKTTYGGEYTKSARDLEDATPGNRLNPSSYLQQNYQYGLAPSRSVGYSDNPKITRTNEYNTREPASNELYAYPSTYEVTLPISRSRLSIGRGGYGGAGSRWRSGGLIGRGVRRIGGRLMDRFRVGSGGGGGWGYGSGYGFGGGAAGGGRWAGLGGAGSTGSGWQGLSNDWTLGGGRGGVNGFNIVSGTPSRTSSGASSWSLATDGTPSNGYYRYGIPSDTTTVTTTGRTSTNSSPGESTQYRINYPNRASTVTTTQSSTVSSEEDPIQYELLFLKDQPSGSTQSQTITPTTSSSSSQVQMNGGSAGGDLRAVNTVTTANDSAGQNVKEYRLVVVDGDKPTTTTTTTKSSGGPNSSASSWTTVSSSGSPSSGGGRGSTWTTVSTTGTPGSVSTSRQGFQVTTPNSSLQLRLPSSSVVNSVLSGTTPTVMEQQTRSMNDGANLASGKLIRVIPVTP